MNSKPKIPIHLKITFLISIIAALALAGFYFYLNNYLTDNTFNRIKLRLEREASLAKTFLEKDFSGIFNYQELDAFSDQVGRDLGLRVTIMGPAGTVFGDSELDKESLKTVENHLNRPEVQQALSSGKGVSRRYSKTVKKYMLYLAYPFGNDHVRGIIRLSIPLSDIETISSRLKRVLIISLSFSFAAILLVSFLVSVFISRPLREMSWTAASIARGDFSNKILVHSNDEVGDLAESINYMSEQINSRIQEVISSRSRLEAVLLSMFEGVMVVDKDGSILLMSESLKKTFQVTSEFIGKRPLEVVRNIEIQEIVDSVIELKEGVESREITLLLPDEKIFLIHAVPVTRGNNLEGGVVVFHDISELRRLEKVRQDFVANVSHELRTPLTSIKGYAETLLQGAIDDKKNARDFLEIIHSDADRLAKLVEDLLDLSRIESGKLKMTLKPCRLIPVVERVVSLLKKQSGARSITIETDINKNLSMVMADEKRLAQILLNLIDNAVKYNKEGGKIIIKATESKGFIIIEVIDSGIGIPEKELPRLFERFYRVDKARSRELGGTGLGLAIVKHIVHSLGGEVSVESYLEQGSTFRFTIPKA
ncbi:MAG: HAMP domain-containing protein [Candidatus Omnitrophica bacterium]|nr:HAMP domain-containing protein [Candidatus Omnitrophota bacterium]